jgi:hypothetical protein
LNCKNIIATDQAEVLENLTLNISKNLNNTDNIDIAELSWGNEENLNNIAKVPDIIICCECLYNEAPWEALLDTLLYFSKLNSSLKIIFAYKKRYKSQELFINEFKKLFDVEHVPKSSFYHEFRITNDYEIFIASLKNK